MDFWLRYIYDRHVLTTQESSQTKCAHHVHVLRKMNTVNNHKFRLSLNSELLRDMAHSCGFGRDDMLELKGLELFKHEPQRLVSKHCSEWHTRSYTCGYICRHMKVKRLHVSSFCSCRQCTVTFMALFHLHDLYIISTAPTFGILQAIIARHSCFLP